MALARRRGAAAAGAAPRPGRARSAGRLGPVLLAAGLVVGVASSVGAQVDPVFPTAQTVWSASCVTPGTTELVVYGRGWAPGAVALSVTDQADRVVGGATATAADRQGVAVFQARVPIGLLGGSSLRLVASQGASTDSRAITVSDSCSPTITAAVGGSCVSAGGRATITVEVGGAPGSIFRVLLHHADLYGPAEVVDRTQPPRAAPDYSFPLTVTNNVPGRVVPVTVEAQRGDGQFAIATTNVALPPACPQPGGTTTTVGRGTTAPPTTAPAAATTAPPTTSAAGRPVPGRPSTFQPLPGGSGAMSLALSPTVGRPGDAATVAGRGFGPSSTVVLRWRPGIGQWTVTAGGDGSFRTQVLVLPNDVEGPRVLEVVGGGPAPASFLVVPGSDQPAFGGVFLSG